jgi:ubiquinone/menaquinone biosynthesis C-methylase UbiE
VIGLDAHATTLELAGEHVRRAWRHAEKPGLELVRGDALALPFGDGSMDYAISSMFFHHLSDEQAVAALVEMLRVARRGIIVNDLLRTAFARLGIHMLTLFADAIDKHDGRVSVAKAWTPGEVEQLKRAAGADWLVYHHHVPARFTLAGLRGGDG